MSYQPSSYPTSNESDLSWISRLSKNELSELFNDDEKLIEKFESLSEVKSMIAKRDEISQQNRRLATENLAVEPKLRDGREMLASAYEGLKKQKEVFDDLRAHIESSAHGNSLDTQLAILDAEAATAEESSEKEMEDFLRSSLLSADKLESFITMFIEKRSRAHLLKMKAEQMDKLITRYSNAPRGYENAPPSMSTPGYRS